MIISNILFVVAGLFLGLSFQGGMWLYGILAALAAAALAYMNLPQVPGKKTTTLPVLNRIVRSTGLSPVVAPDIRNSVSSKAQEFNESDSNKKNANYWTRANADVNKATTDILRALQRLIPHANTLIVFAPLASKDEWAISSFAAEQNANIATDISIKERTGILGQLFRNEISRLLEGGLTVKKLSYYIDNPAIKSLAAVPIFDKENHRVGALLVDSLYPNAFTESTVNALNLIASTLFTIRYKCALSTKNFIAQQQFSVLYSYLHKFFQNMTVKDIFQLIAQYIEKNIPFDRMLILALDRENNEDNNVGHVVVAKGIDSEQFVNKRFTLSDKGISVLALTHNRAVERKESFLMQQYIPRIDDKENKNLEFRHLYVLPLANDDSTKTAKIAVSLESRIPGRYSEHELELLKAFAGMASFAYERACAFENRNDLATRDGLTGLINHRTLQEKLRAEKIKGHRMGYNIGILMMDIDHFKSVNDTYGHPVGDIVIKGIGATLSSEIRNEVDIVARYGGEEFVVALIDTTPEGLVDTAERIRRAVQRLEFDVKKQAPLRVSVSIGAFLVTPEFPNIKDALNNADQALYKAKEGGRNQVIQYKDENIIQHKD